LRPADTAIVEDDHAAPPCHPVNDGRVPIVEDAGEVMQKDDRRTTGIANHPIGEVSPINVNRLGRGIAEPEVLHALHCCIVSPQVRAGMS
jgi:hypothetical protein